MWYVRTDMSYLDIPMLYLDKVITSTVSLYGIDVTDYGELFSVWHRPVRREGHWSGDKKWRNIRHCFLPEHREQIEAVMAISRL